jgi:hypothetical protein
MKCTVFGNVRPYNLVTTQKTMAAHFFKVSVNQLPNSGDHPGPEADHLYPSGAKVKNVCIYKSTLQYVFIEWYLITHKGNCTFTLCNYTIIFRIY